MNINNTLSRVFFLDTLITSHFSGLPSTITDCFQFWGNYLIQKIALRFTPMLKSM